ncbi:MAG: ATP-binding protein involved in chromosome partitioning [Planctomycetota bacterium]|jgi:ATP-binding protein involved in chromosome partitioning
MSAPTGRQDEVLKALSIVMDPDLNKNIVELGFIKDLKIDGGNVSFEIELTTPACPVKEQLKQEAEDAVSALKWTDKLEITMTAQVQAAVPMEGAMKIRNIIAVASGKGGVGKSTVSANLAFALSEAGASVGILDADIYGPSMPLMLGLGQAQPKTTTDENGQTRMFPFERNGVKVMSMGFLVPPEKAMIWRGPMVHGALQQFFGQVEWGELDYLVIDLPPGTGDAQLTMTQTVPVSGAVIVTTPQDVAMIDAKKAYNMFAETNVPILGIVENMSFFECPNCNHESHIFGHDGARVWAEELNVRFLGKIPIDLKIREHGDDGTPAVIAKDTPDRVRKAFKTIAEQAASEISMRNHAKGENAPLELSN